MNWWTVLVLLLPVINYKGIMHTTEVPRFILLAAFLALFLLYFYVRGRPRLEISPLRPLTRVLGALALGFLAVLVLTSCAAFNRQEALFRSFQYLLTLLATVLFAATVMREEELLPRLFQALAVALLIQAVVGILQFYQVAFVDTAESTRVSPRALPYGLMGNRNLLASALALLVPPCAWLIGTGSRDWKVIGGGALWVGIYALILTQTRSVWLALAAAVAVSTLLVLLRGTRWDVTLVGRYFRGLGLCLGGAALAVLVSVTIPNSQDLAGSLSRRATALAGPGAAANADSSISARLLWWRQSREMMHDHPFLGIGPGNWRFIVPAYGCGRPGELPAIAKGGFVRDHAHNVYLQMGAETGLAGFVLYAALWAVAGWLALRGVLNTSRNDRRLFAMVGLAAICVYVVDSLFSFPDDVVAHSLFIALALGIVIGLYEKGGPVPAALPRSAPWGKALVLLVVLLLGFGVYLGYALGRFEYHNLRAREFVKAKQPEKVLAEVDAGLTPLVTLSHYTEPLEVYVGHAYAQMNRFDQAAEAFDRAHAMNPWNIYVSLDRASHLIRMKRWDDAIGGFQEILRLAPEFDLAREGLARAYYGKGLYQQCCDTLAAVDYTKEESLANLAGTAQLKLGNYAQSAATFRAGLQQFPNATNLLDTLAYVEYTYLKNLSNAGVHYKRVLALQPDHPQRDEYNAVIKYCERRLTPATNALPVARGTNAPAAK
jgi:O-antigen ligase